MMANVSVRSVYFAHGVDVFLVEMKIKTMVVLKMKKYVANNDGSLIEKNLHLVDSSYHRS